MSSLLYERTRLLPRHMVLELYIWMTVGSFSIQVLIQVCLPMGCENCWCMPSNAVNEYQAFVNDVNDALQRIGSIKSSILLGDFNAHIGTDCKTWKGVIGKHRDPALNENGRNSLQLCFSNGLCIMNTFFKQTDFHKYTWYRASMAQKSSIDFCIVSLDFFLEVLDVRAK